MTDLRAFIHTLGAIASLVAPVAAVQLDTLADSVAQFSSVQGQDGWSYGYIDVASGPTFVPFTVFQTNYPTAYGSTPAWVIDALPASPPYGNTHFFTELNSVGGCPNALVTSANEPREQWADRRWTSTVAAPVTISGLIGDYSAYGEQPQDGVLAEVLVNGVVIWSLQTDGDLHEIPYAVSASLTAGSIVDFLVKPGTTDYLDQFTFTGVIQTPAPPGDVNGDGIVNGQDIATVSSNWLGTGSAAAGDANGDGIVNGQDLALISSNWLASIYSTQVAQVPEPPTFICAALSLLVVTLRRRQVAKPVV